MPRGAGGIPMREKTPSSLLSAAISRSPWRTLISTDVWASAAVEKTSDFLAGIVVFRSISFVMTPPSVSTPRESGVTSSRRRSFTSPARTPPCSAAPMATTSSGLTPLCGSLPKKSLTICWIFGMRVCPPTRTTSSIFAASRLASFSACRHGPTGRWRMSSTSDSGFRPGQLKIEVLRPGRVGRDEGEVDLALERRRQLDLGLLGGLLEALHRHRVLREIDPLVLLELREQPVDDPLVDVVAAQVGVAIRRLHLDDPFPHLEDRDVEGPAAEVVDGDRLVLLLVETVGERGRRRLVDEALHLQPGDLSGVLGRLALGVVEVGGDRDDGPVDLLAQVGLGRFLQLREDHCRDLGGSHLLPPEGDARVAVRRADHLVGHHLHLVVDLLVPAAHESLDRVDRVLVVRHGLPLGDLPDEPLP